MKSLVGTRVIVRNRIYKTAVEGTLVHTENTDLPTVRRDDGTLYRTEGYIETVVDK